MKIIIPIAGRGSRFKNSSHLNPEFNNPKPFITVKGRPMVCWAVASIQDMLTGMQDLIFVQLQEHEERYHTSSMLKSLFGSKITIITIPHLTRGAAETVLAAKDSIDNGEPLIISDSDHYFDGSSLKNGINQYPGIDGLIPVFKSMHPKWSFSREDKDGFVDLVAEKQPISPWANLGGYYFRSGHDFVTHATQMIRENAMTNNEFYIAPVYNRLIASGKKIKLVHPAYSYGLGTPEDVAYFEKNTTCKIAL